MESRALAALTALGRAGVRLGLPEETAVPSPAPAFPFGLGARGVHEVVEADYGDMAALTGFALAASGTDSPGLERQGAIIRVAQAKLADDHGDWLQAGLAAFRRPAPACLTVRPRTRADALWTIEEAIRSAAVALVVGEIDDLDFTASRRLTLAARRHGVPAILLMPYAREGATSADGRWRVSAAPSAPNPFDRRAPGKARWRAVLERCRTASHMTGCVFDLEHDDETLSLRVADQLAAQPAPASPPRPLERCDGEPRIVRPRFRERQAG